MSGHVDDFVKSLNPVGVSKDRELFESEVNSDESLAPLRELANKTMRGYKWVNGLLVQGKYVDWEVFREVLAVPKQYRTKIMRVAHDLGGHMCSEKVLARVKQYFVRPSMSKDISEYCKSCNKCQFNSKYKPRKAPMITGPILSEPFESIAIDLVGPLEKGKGGYRYLLTSVCLATKWPEAVPLKLVTARSVADGLWQIFAHTGVSESILSDQGSQFCSKLVKKLCELTGIERFRTSPYHPQTNGLVERMHSTFKSVLAKCISRKQYWVGQVPFVLLALRQMPQSDSGFSPFDLVFEHRVRTPLDALYHGIFECTPTELNVCEWVKLLAERLSNVRDVAALNITKAREKRESYFNKGSKLREFEVGDRVLYRVPGLTCKLSDSWDGPFVVQDKKGLVNYRIGRDVKKKNGEMVHVNSIKKYVEQININRLDVVIDEDVDSTLLDGACTGYDESKLGEVLDKHVDVFF